MGLRISNHVVVDIHPSLERSCWDSGFACDTRTTLRSIRSIFRFFNVRAFVPQHLLRRWQHPRTVEKPQVRDLTFEWGCLAQKSAHAYEERNSEARTAIWTVYTINVCEGLVFFDLMILSSQHAFQKPSIVCLCENIPFTLSACSPSGLRVVQPDKVSGWGCHRTLHPRVESHHRDALSASQGACERRLSA